MEATDINDVLVKLTGIIAKQRELASPLAFFSAVYHATTSRVLAGIQGGTFADGARMNRLATTFANRYLAALDAVAVGGPARAWQVAFDAAARPHTMILQHVLLGMNAHINFDLPLAVIATAGEGSIADLKGDFDAINRILADLLNPVQSVLDGFSPLLKILDQVGGRVDGKLVTFSIDIARQEAWHEATRLADESSDERKTSTLSLDRGVAVIGQGIIGPDGALGLATSLIARTESADIAAVTDALLAIV